VKVTLRALAALAVLAGVLAGCGDGDGGASSTTTTREARRPNIVVVMTDDQAVESVRVMSEVARLAAAGTTFTRAYASFPVCCPSRATFLTGQYAHNHGVIDNIPPAGGYYRLDSAETLPVWLTRAGYRTIHIGKYLNQWGKDGPPEVPPGWTEWFGLIDPSTYRYFDYFASVNGTMTRFRTAERDYQTDVLARRSVEAIRRAADDGRPFYLQLWTLAPHSTGRLSGEEGLQNLPPIPAPRHEGAFADEALPDMPSFDEEDVSDKPRFVRELPRLDDDAVEHVTGWYRAELESLLAVDEAMRSVRRALEEAEVADDTVVIFTSDNGYLHGEHRIVEAKTFLYEPSARIPLVIAGPGFTAGREVGVPVANVDVVRTVLGLTGATPGLPQDGLSLIDVARRPRTHADRAVLLDNRNGGIRATSTGVVTARFTYMEHSTGERELYDLESDPDQLENVADRPGRAVLQRRLAERLEFLRRCAGPACNEEPA
jgi:arylsulfatase A-like enzyme